MANVEYWTPEVQQANSQQQVMEYVRGLMQQGRNEEARAELENILQQDRSNTQAIMALGLTFMRERRFQEAAARFEDALASDPKSEPAALLSAICGMRAENPEYAEANFHKALEINPKSMTALTSLARLHRNNNKTDEALQVLQRAVEVDPQATRARLQMANLFLSLGRQQEAVAQLERVLTIEPSNQRAAIQLANLQMEQGRSNDAVSTLTSAMELASNKGPLLAALGRLKLRGEDWAGAEKVFRQLSTTGENQPNPMAQMGLVQALIPQKKLKEAREMLARIPLNRRGSLVQRLYGDAFAIEGRYDAAEESYRAALREMPNGEEALSRIDAAKAAENGSPEAVLALYRSEFDRLREELRGGRGRRPQFRQGQGQGRRGGPLAGRLRGQLGGRMGGWAQGQAGGGAARMGGGGLGGGAGPAMAGPGRFREWMGAQGGNDPDAPQGGPGPRGGFLRELIARRRQNGPQS